MEGGVRPNWDNALSMVFMASLTILRVELWLKEAKGSGIKLFWVVYTFATT